MFGGRRRRRRASACRAPSAQAPAPPGVGDGRRHPAGRGPAGRPQGLLLLRLHRHPGRLGGDPRRGGHDYERAELVLYSDAVSTGGCGSATSAVGPFYCPADERVYLDLSFYEDMRRQLGASGDFAWAYVIAHEMGHHVQNITGTSDEVDALSRRRPRPGQRALGPPGAPGRLLLGSLGKHDLRRGRSRARRPRRGLRRGRGGRRRPAPGAGRRERQPRQLHPRHQRAAPGLVRARLRVRRAGRLRHVQRRGRVARIRCAVGPTGNVRESHEHLRSD